MNRLLLFDLGGVLIRNDMFAQLQQLMGTSESEAVIKSKWLASPAVRDFELGRCTPDQFSTSIVEEFQLQTTPAAFLDAFAGWPKGFYAGAPDLLVQLRKKSPVGCLSNSNELHWTDQLTSHFDHAYSSHQLQRIKPDPDVFDFVTTDVGVKPHQIVFFDDSQPNVDAALAFGWEAHLTVGFSELNQVLRTLGAVQ